MKNFIYIIFLFFVLNTLAQNRTEKVFSANNITDINVVGEKVFKIIVEAKPIKEIKIYSKAEGEHSEDIFLATQIKNNTLHVEIKEQPFFVNDNDKLSAHKFISAELIIVIPENLKLFISSLNASVIVNGQYKNVTLDLNQGNCFMYQFYGNAKIYTLNGNVTLNTNQANINATTKNGTVKKEQVDAGFNQIEIKTINGNITITKSQ